MGLPDLIEIVPLEHPFQAKVAVPGSKSITNRALILAALAEGETLLRHALWSEDTQVMVECLQELGFMVNVAPDTEEESNRNITVYGKAGTVPAGGTQERPLELFIGNAGTAARFLTAFLCLGSGVYRLDGVARMRERPQAALFDSLRTLGYAIDSPNNRLPALIRGGGPRPGNCRVSIQESSQFASALLLCAKTGEWRVAVDGENAEESPYVTMTSKLIEVFPRKGGTFLIEPDASSGSYFLAADRLLPRTSRVEVTHWPASGWQVDQRFPGFLPRMDSATVPVSISRVHDLGDSILTAMILAPYSAAPVQFKDLARLRVQECERVQAIKTELGKCGGRVHEENDSLTIAPSKLHGAEIETYDDHRIAMCFAILGLKVPAMRIRNPACVKKTFPDFFRKLAAPTPAGLGAKILDARNRRELARDELFAG